MKKILSYISRLWYPIRDNAMFFVLMYSLGIVVNYVSVLKLEWLYCNLWCESLIDFYILCLIITLLQRSSDSLAVLCKWLKRLIYVFSYTLSIVDVFCYIKFKSGISPSILQLISETNGSETSEFLSTYVTGDLLVSGLGWVLLVMLIHIAITVVTYYYKRRGELPYRIENLYNRLRNFYDHKQKRLIIDSAVSLVILIMFIIGSADAIRNKTYMYKVLSSETIGDMEKEIAISRDTSFYLPAYRFFHSIVAHHLANQQLDILKSGIKKVEVDSCSVKSPEIVLIIGESYNKRHSQLYGYDKETTPWQMEMEKAGRLVKMNDIVAPWNLTSFVFKHLLTTYSVGDKGDWCNYPLFPQLFRQSGYEVAFFTNQFLHHAKDALYDFSGGFFINDELLSKTMFDIRNEDTHFWDMDLTKDYDRLVGRQDSLDAAKGISKPRLNIFHFMGQHVNYRVRCPKSKMRFFASQYNLPQNTAKEVQNIAYYDNAVWYNDTVVSCIAKRFEDKEAIIIYFSDHGEEVYGPGSLHHCGRNHAAEIDRNIAREEYDIPMWFYFTPKYAARHQDVVSNAKAAANKPFMTDALAHILLGLAGIDCRYYRPDLDLLNPQYNASRKRYLKHVTDYDVVTKQ